MVHLLAVVRVVRVRLRLRLLLVLLLVTLSLKDSGGDAVKVTHAVLRDLAATVGVGLKDTNLLEGLDNVALDTGGRVAVVAGADTAAVLGAVELGEGTDTDVLAEVDVTGNGRCMLVGVLSSMISESCGWRSLAGLRHKAKFVAPLKNCRCRRQTSTKTRPRRTHRRGRRTSRGRKARAPSGHRS